MKNLFKFIFAISIFLLGSCTFNGQDGAPGPQGPEGPPGPEAYVFEYVDLTFSASNDYSLLLEFPDNFEMLESDKVLVYFLYSDPTADEADLWRLLPQTEFTDHGTLIYNYDFTRFDVALFLDANFDLNLLGAIFTDNWIARVVVIPGQFQNGRVESPVDYKDYNAVMEHYDLTDQNIILIE